MAYISENIKRLFYFVESQTIYEISKHKDADNCGLCMGYTKTEDGDYVIKEHSELATIFPYFTITYLTYKLVEDKDEEGNKVIKKVIDDTIPPVTKYFWLQDLIHDGDKIANNKFVCTVGLHGDTSATFLDRYIKKVTEDAVAKIKNNYLPDELRRQYPGYLIGTPYDSFVDGKDVKVTATSLTAAQQILSDANIETLYNNAAKEKATASANTVLRNINNQVDTLEITTEPITD